MLPALKLRTHFALLVAVTLVPVLVLAVSIVFLVQRERRLSFERGLQEKTGALAVAIDREFESSITALNSLAATPFLDLPDLPAFYEQAMRTRAVNRRWLTVYLVEPSGRQLMTLLRPLGTALPDASAFDFVQAVRQTGQPYVSNLEFGPVSRRHIIHINVPVMRQGRLRYILGASVVTDALADVLTGQVSSAGSLAAVRDRRDILVARSRDHQRYLGRPPSPEFKEKIRSARERGATLFEAESLEGSPVLVAVSRVPTSDFSVLVAVPVAAVAAEPQRLWGLLSVGGIVLLAAALVISALLARRIARPIMALSKAAGELANGQPISMSPTSPVAEVSAVRDAMVRTAEALRERSAERERRLAAEAARAEAERRTHTMEQLSREKDEFLAMLGHELRNPLGAIASANSVLGLVGNAEPSAGRARAIIGRQVQHLVDIVDDLLDVSRVTMGKIVLTRRPVDFAGVVSRCLDSLTVDGRTRAHEVSFDSRSVWVDGDETRLEQIAGNIITNALKYTPTGGRVRISVAQENNEAVLRVQDNGLGISAERLPQIFDLFYQGERPLDRSHGGLGIGLTLVKRLTELHGGRVAAASGGVNKGTTFSVHLPAIATVTPNDSRLLFEENSAPPMIHRVVLIEDNDDAREMLRTALALAGHIVWEAEDGLRGIELVRSRRPDAVVVDINLPGLNGYEVGRRLRELPEGHRLRLIALTGYGQAEDRRRSKEAGFDAHLVKPIDAARLERVLSPGDGPVPHASHRTEQS
jgi:signal transduction histidine kinase/ActR/RegA family two-component response regulator